MARTNTREEIIRKGAELIHAQGFNATGLQQILQAAAIPKGSFYFYFKSKEDFGLEIINYFNSTISGVLANYLGDKKIPPIERVEKLFEFFETVYQNNGYTLGCPIGNLSLELADTNDRLRAHLDGVIKSLIAQIESCLQEAQLDKSIPANLNPADVARFIFYGFEGALLHMKVVKNIEPFRVFRSCLKGYLTNTKASKKKSRV
ncbi:MAG: TetR family transcriptional regulator C-terminal domain-containing protein [Syntrophaceae bacterium]|nr:TetR family transcriptional regulator C-terminal domain-containing protein [Syntrophaceae bacterium]